MNDGRPTRYHTADYLQPFNCGMLWIYILYTLASDHYTIFQERAQHLAGEINSEGSLDDWNASLGLMILEAASSTVPLKKNPRSPVLVPWWNKECEKAVRNRAHRK